MPLLIGQNPQRGRGDVIRTLESTARPLAGAGHGLIDAAAALRLRATPQSTAPSSLATAAVPPLPAGSARPMGAPQLAVTAEVPASPSLLSATPLIDGPTATARAGAVTVSPGTKPPDAQLTSSPRDLLIPVLLALAGLFIAASIGLFRSVRRPRQHW